MNYHEKSLLSLLFISIIIHLLRQLVASQTEKAPGIKHIHYTDI